MASTTGLTGPPKPPPRVARQDVAPPGGYPPIDIRRNVPKSVSVRSSVALFLGGSAVMAWGFYRVGQWNIHRRMLKQEKKDIRLAIMPLLQAEEDARYVKDREAYEKWEKGAMKDVPGWDSDPNVYKTRSFMQPVLSTAAYSR